MTCKGGAAALLQVDPEGEHVEFFFFQLLRAASPCTPDSNGGVGACADVSTATCNCITRAHAAAEKHNKGMRGSCRHSNMETLSQ